MLSINKILVLLFLVVVKTFSLSVHLKKRKHSIFVIELSLKLHYTDLNFNLGGKNAHLSQLTVGCNPWRKGKRSFDFCGVRFTKTLHCALFSVFYPTAPVVWFFAALLWL